MLAKLQMAIWIKDAFDITGKESVTEEELKALKSRSQAISNDAS